MIEHLAARALPASEGRPPFLITVDVGHLIEIYAEFSRSGATYTPFPDPRSHRIRLAELADEAVLARLKAIWHAPDSLDPARVAARALAAFEGDDAVGRIHLKAVAPMALSHRLRRDPLDEAGSTSRVIRAVAEVLP